VKVGDLVRYKPTHNVDHIRTIYDGFLGLVIAGECNGDITKLLTPCGSIFWAVRKDCEVVSEGR